MMVATGRTYWSKDPDEAPPYSDWEIIFAKNGEDHTDKLDAQNDDDENDRKGSDSNNKNKRRKHNNSRADGDARISKTAIAAATTTYHVHRNMIGPRSEYFNRIFDENRHGTAAFSESRNHRSVIEFSTALTQDSFDHIVQAFELFLDYCYLDSTSTSYKHFLRRYISPVALVFLSDYFQIFKSTIQISFLISSCIQRTYEMHP